MFIIINQQTTSSGLIENKDKMQQTKTTKNPQK